jgi:hypothetical protein
MVTKLDIIRHIEKATGRTLSFDTIEKWHKSALLPRPIRKSLGKGKGTISGYPDGTAEQALVVYRKREEGKNLDRILADLFQENRVVDVKQVRELLFKGLDVSEAITSIKRQLLQYESPDRVDEAIKLLTEFNQDKANEDQLELWGLLVSGICNLPEIEHVSKILNLSDNDIYHFIDIAGRSLSGDPSIEDAFTHNPIYEPVTIREPDSLRGFSERLEQPDDKSSAFIFSDVTGIPVDTFTRESLLLITSKLFNTKHIIHIFYDMTDEQLVKARDDFNILKTFLPTIANILKPFANHPLLSEFIKEVKNPMSVYYRITLIGLISFRKDKKLKWDILMDRLAASSSQREN